ncbi:hypothetical protein, partial [Nonomuraea sp. NPDC005650]|uniref:hypothetical protein n=1 Tax=Nonomuraea sp. NPDC005650 TaxID=3157045 RepID=UPI0033A0DE11
MKVDDRSSLLTRRSLLAGALSGAGLAAWAADAVLSFCRRGTASSPPGWERVYANVAGPLTA